MEPDYPHLAHLLAAYFHQDCYLDAADDAEILAGYIAHSTQGQILALIADIERFLHDHAEDPLPAAQRLFQPDIIIGGSNAEARDWFAAILVYLRTDDAACPPTGGPRME